MYYKPHILQKRSVASERDAYGRIITYGAEWEDVCECRCDDSGDSDIEDENGRVYRPTYHIVCDGSNAKVSTGMEIRVIDKKSGELRGEGKVVNVKHLNYYNYTEVWV